MLSKFNLPFFLHLLSISLLFFIPGLYIPEILPFFLLPILSGVIILLTFFYEKIGIRFIPSIILSALILFITHSVLFFLFESIHSSLSDRFFRIGQITVCFADCVFVVCMFCFTHFGASFFGLL